jgi:DNA processing protein
VTLGSDAYPSQLAEIPDPPAALWMRGAATALLAGPQLAMVGSRNPTAGGAANATAFARALGGSGLTITSGLALGIDGASHAGALETVGSTVAVLGSGIDRVYPAEHRALGDRIAAAGLIVSEYPPGTPVRKHQFPARNRIIAGLATGTLVVEATRRSGSLITARLAAEFGREVVAGPGSIHNPRSRGCQALIVQGARLVEAGGDVLTELAPRLRSFEGSEPRPEDFAEAPVGLDSKQRKLLDLLGFEPIARDELAARAGLTAAELSSMLLLLEMKGVVEALPGARYCRLVKRS